MKKIVSICLVAIMLMSVLVSCDNVNKVDDTVSSDVSVDQTSEEITTSPITEVETEAPVVMKEYDLSKFTIIYDEVYSLKLATDLRTKIKDEFGIDVTLKKASKTKVYDCELIIGNAARDISAACFDLENDKYLKSKGIVCDNGKIQLLGIDRTTIEASIKYFFENMVNKETKTVTVPEKGESIVEITHESISIPKKTDASLIRFVTNNILGQGITPSWDRLTGLVGAYIYYDADIYTLQEVDKPWHSTYKLTERMEWLGYSLVKGNSEVACPIYYKTERFELIDGGWGEYDTANLAETTKKYYAWACLKEKETGKKLIVTSTHFIANGAGATAEKKANRDIHRNECAKQLLDIVADLQKKYQADVVISAGDFNANVDTAAYKTMKSGMTSARENCEKRVNMNFNTENVLGKMPSKSRGYIDHVFYTNAGVTAKHYETIISPYSYAYADHVPVLFDFYLN